MQLCQLVFIFVLGPVVNGCTRDVMFDAISSIMQRWIQSNGIPRFGCDVLLTSHVEGKLM